MPGQDPEDINSGANFIFLDKDASEKMWHNKRKVTYIFEDEKLNNNEQNDETN